MILGERTDSIESKMGEYAGAHNQLVDAHNTLEQEVTWLRNKVTDLEDRSRRNIKVRGIPESLSPAEIHTCLQDKFQILLPLLSPLDLTLDKAHRIPKGCGVPEHTPRGALLQKHFYHVKDMLLSRAHKENKLPYPYRPILLFPNLSATTLQHRRQFQIITAGLRDHQLRYGWCFLPKLNVTREGSQHVIPSPEEGIALLQSWNISVLDTLALSQNTPPWRLEPAWSQG